MKFIETNSKLLLNIEDLMIGVYDNKVYCNFYKEPNRLEYIIYEGDNVDIAYQCIKDFITDEEENLFTQDDLRYHVARKLELKKIREAKLRDDKISNKGL